MIDWVAVKKAGDKWDSMKEFFSRPDVAGASAGALIGGGLGAGLGLVTSPKKGLSAGVHGGIGALTGGLAGFGVGRNIMKDQDIRKMELRSAVERVLNKAARSTKWTYDDKGERIPDEEYTARMRKRAEEGLKRVGSIFDTRKRKGLPELRDELWDDLKYGSWMYGEPGDRLPLEKAIYPEQY